MYEFVQVHLTWVTDTGVCAPVVTAVAVLRADVGVAGVSQVAAVLHADLQALSHVSINQDILSSLVLLNTEKSTNISFIAQWFCALADCVICVKKMGRCVGACMHMNAEL